MKYLVTYDQAVWERTQVLVEADSPEEAEDLVIEGGGEIQWMANDTAVDGMDPFVVIVVEDGGVA